MAEERLQKVMAAAGVASRRACEELIVAGRVQVNGHTVRELGTKVDPEVVQIAVDGVPVHQPRRHVYIKLHKPRGILSDVGGDLRGREGILDLLPEDLRRVFPVGRLDHNSEGLLLLTDDGELANRLTHPRYQHPKTYFVLVEQRPTEQALDQLRHGVPLPTGRSAPAEVKLLERLPAELALAAGLRQGVWLQVVLREGKKRQIRHMTAAVGHPTLRLVRWAIGPLTLGRLKAGEHVHLSHREVSALRQMVQAGQTTAGTPATRRPTHASTGKAPGARTQPERRQKSTRGQKAWTNNR
jgi:23S rRNA pseudouridine2605 synthase